MVSAMRWSARVFFSRDQRLVVGPCDRSLGYLRICTYQLVFGGRQVTLPHLSRQYAVRLMSYSAGVQRLHRSSPSCDVFLTKAHNPISLLSVGVCMSVCLPSGYSRAGGFATLPQKYSVVSFRSSLRCLPVVFRRPLILTTHTLAGHPRKSRRGWQPHGPLPFPLCKTKNRYPQH